MKTKLLVTMTLTLGLTGINLLAQDGRPPEGPDNNRERKQRPIPPLMQALDANQDGKISADEITKASAALKSLDKNNDGELASEELRPQGMQREGERAERGERSERRERRSFPGDSDIQRPEGHGGHGGAGGQGGPNQERVQRFKSPFFSALDVDGDEELSSDEINRAPTSLVALDKNKDGRVSKDELRPQGAGPKGQHGDKE